jgi:hypothetical protein
MKIKSLWLASIAAILLAGCGSGSMINGGRNDDDDDDQEQEEGTDADTLATDPRNPPELIAGVSSFFREKCVDCHGNSRTYGDINDIFDVVALKDKGLISEKADSSRLFLRIGDKKHAASEINPISQKPIAVPTDQELQLVREWIDIGAPSLRSDDREPIDLSRYLQFLRNDQSRALRSEQNQLVYVDFHAVYNNKRYANAELQAFANATLKLLNQLDVDSTTAGKAGASVVLNKDNLPLAVRFDPARFNLDKRRDIEDIIIRLSNRNDVDHAFPCDVPAIPVLDFLHIASSDDVFNPLGDLGAAELGTFESGYSNIVLKKLFVRDGILSEDQVVFPPIDEDTFIKNGFTNKAANVNVFDLLRAIDPTNFNRADLDITYNKGNDKERFVRGCMEESFVSAGNRCIDRMSQSLPANGSTWLSFDILSTNNGAQDKDFFAKTFVGPANPPGDELVKPREDLDPFKIDGGEGIFQLPNSMLGFFVYNANFEILSNPPTSAVLNNDNDQRGSFISVSACSSCHYNFTIPFEDDVAPTLERISNGSDFTALGFAQKFSQSQDKWNARFSIDRLDYVQALKRVYVSYEFDKDPKDGIWSLGKQYINNLGVDEVVAELGFFSREELEDAVDNNVDLQLDVAALFAGGISRENYIVNYQNLVDTIAPGPADFLRGCVSRVASDVDDVGTD